jgi:carbamoyltransferase
MNSRGKPSVILNTSFNIRGKPILTSIEDAFYVLENTELDFLVIENLLFYK